MKLEAAGFQLLSPALQNLRHLRILKLRNCRVDQAAASSLADRRQSSLHYSEVLDLSFNSIGNGWTDLAPALASLPSLHQLELQRTQLSKDARAIAHVLPELQQLEVRNLGRNNLGDAGLSALHEAISLLSNLHELSLHDNAISDVGASALSPRLSQLTNLLLLDLSQNDFGNDGATALASALPHLLQLETLRLDNNNIGPA